MTPRGKRALFWSATVLTPFLLLGLVEVALRIAGLFAPEPVVVDVPGTNGRMVRFNMMVARRYFDEHRTVVPAIAPESFTREKPASTIRILCLGESTTAGFPFECQVPFPAQLREILAQAYPDRRVEVLNAGISAISSYVVVDMLPDLLEATHPDAVIGYLGHNEFYGVYGSGSAILSGSSPALTRLVLRLQHLRLAQMVKSIIDVVRPRVSAPPEDRTLMQSVVRDQEISFNSRQYRAGMEALRENLNLLVDCCRDRDVPTVLSTLVSNEVDLPPFRDRSDTLLSIEARTALHSALASGDSLMRLGLAGEAAARYRDAVRADSENADAWYGLGRSLLALGDTSEAERRLAGARDRDVMRFRASGEANEIIRTVARERHAGLTDMAAVFRRASPGGLIGSSLLCDHLHPNPQGYYLMAAAFFGTIEEMGVLPPPGVAVPARRMPYGVTDLDWDIGLLKIFEMTHRWPFREAPVTRADYVPHGDSIAARVAERYLYIENVWSRAHNAMAQEYRRRGDYRKARAEYEAIAVFSPDDPWPYTAIAELAGEAEDWQTSAAALQEAIRRSPRRGLLEYRLALAESKLHNLEGAVRNMELASGEPELTPSERQNARFYLSGFLYDSGLRDRARRVLLGILADDPSFPPAREFLRQMERKH